MIERLATALAPSPPDLGLMAVTVFFAGLVRSFTGFALSAMIMASLALLLPPVALIPVCHVLEGTASLLMFRGGAHSADWLMVWSLAVGSALGVPLGSVLFRPSLQPFYKRFCLVLLIALALAGLLRLARVG